MEQEDIRKEEASRAVVRNTLMTEHKFLMSENTRKKDDMTEKWKQTQMVKKGRQIHDLQYELAVSKRIELKSTLERQDHTRQEKTGIVEFEKNMKKLGLVGNDTVDGGMVISYEASEAFEERIKQLAGQKLSTNEEISNFKNQLKDRTAANRLARYEKARRRRRAAVQQNTESDSKEQQG
jgi:regulator of replication initiation timing